MTALVVIAVCMFGGLYIGFRQAATGRLYVPPAYLAQLRRETFGTDDLRDWSREIGPAALRAVK